MKIQLDRNIIERDKYYWKREVASISDYLLETIIIPVIIEMKEGI